MKKRTLIMFTLIAISFALSCSGGGSGTAIRVVPSLHNYNTISVPNFEEFDYVIKNSSANAITIQQMQFSGANPTEFFISKNGSVPKTLYGNSEVTITIQFKPTSKGNKSATLEIKHSLVNVDPLTVRVTGNAITAPAIQLSDTALNFGDRFLTEKSTKTFTLQSTGTEDLYITNLGFGGTAAAEFKVTAGPSIPANITPGGSVNITIEWTAGSPVGLKSATMNIQHNAVGGSSIISLTAESKPYTPLAITTSSIANGKVWTAYNDDFNCTGGNTKEEWTVFSGDFPKGLDINLTTGEITGAPAYPGVYTFVIQVDDSVSNDTKQYKITVDKDGSWKDVTPNGFSVYARTAVAAHEFDLYFIGGANNDYGMTDIKKFDTKNNTFGSAGVSLQTARERAVAACVGKYIYIFGGRSNSFNNGTTIGTVERFDTSANTISTDTYMPNNGQYNTTCGVHNGKIYILGGATPNDTKVYEFTPGTSGANGTWATKADLDFGYDAMGFVSYNAKIYLIGGYLYGNINDIFEYDPAVGKNLTPVGATVQSTGKMQYGFITESCYIVDNGDNLQKYNFDAFTAHSSAYPNCPLVTTESWSSQNVECMGRIYITMGDAPSTQVYAYTP